VAEPEQPPDHRLLHLHVLAAEVHLNGAHQHELLAAHPDHHQVDDEKNLPDQKVLLLEQVSKAPTRQLRRRLGSWLS
jgi:mRNA-degrading endonuclease toxin of MazEF toxin-antitoxin module